MKKLRHKHAVPPMRLAATSAAVAAVFAGAAGIASAHGYAALSKAQRGSHHQPVERFARAKLEHGVLVIRGTKGDDEIALRLEAGDPNVLQVDVDDNGTADFSFDRAAVARIDVDARRGDDRIRIDEGNGAFTNGIPTAIDGGDGNDTIAGGAGAETLLGGDGNDSIDGNGGADQAQLGAGDDTFVWDPGDGSDTIEGQDGTDTMVFNGAAAAEQVDLSANGNRLRFFRNPGNITMDTHGVERVDFNALGGADVVTVNDLTGTDVESVNVDLAGSLGGVTGDGAADRVVVDGTNGNDRITVNGDAGGVKVSGLAATVELLHAEATDRLELNTLAGTDAVDTAGLAAGSLQLFVNGLLRP
jgi:hypothetical protein